jgi:hypothetical protein
MRYSLLIDGVVKNIIECEPEFAANQAYNPATKTGYLMHTTERKGDVFDGVGFAKLARDMQAYRAALECETASIKDVLDDAGLLDDADAAIALAPRKIQRRWAQSSTLTRVSTISATLRAALSKTPAQWDQIFEAAKAVEP